MYMLFRLRSICCHLTKQTLEQLVLSLVMSNLDYCSIIFYGLPTSSINKLQRVQNFAAKLVEGKKKFDSASECLKSLHWLPIKSRILFRLLCMSFKCVHGLAPSYLSTFFQVKQNNYSLRSNNSPIYEVPKSYRKTFGDRAFSVAWPQEWNKLPHHLKIITSFTLFKKHLKTHLFSAAFK